MQYSIEIRDIHKIEKKNSYSFFVHIAQLLFVVMKTRKDIQCVSKKKKKNAFKRQVDLLLIGQESKRHYALVIN